MFEHFHDWRRELLRKRRFIDNVDSYTVWSAKYQQMEKSRLFITEQINSFCSEFESLMCPD